MGLENLAAIDSAAAWLVRHGRHVQKLRLGEAWWSVEDRACASALATCLSMAGLAPQLADLTVDVYCEVHTEWLRTMCLLRRLNLTADSAPMHIAPSITALTALQSLELRSTRIQLPPGLPASITRLGVETDCSEEMPVQASGDACLGQVPLCSKNCGIHPCGCALVIDGVAFQPCLPAVCSAAAAAAPQALCMRLLSPQPVPVLSPQRQPNAARCPTFRAAHTQPSGAHASAALAVLSRRSWHSGGGDSLCSATPDRPDLPGEPLRVWLWCLAMPLPRELCQVALLPTPEHVDVLLSAAGYGPCSMLATSRAERPVAASAVLLR